MIRLEQEPLRTHTTFRIGGPAAYYFIPEREEEIIEALDFAKEKGLSYYVIGKGSNCLLYTSGCILGFKQTGKLDRRWQCKSWKRCECSCAWRDVERRWQRL